jgi:hypothetical protein
VGVQRAVAARRQRGGEVLYHILARQLHRVPTREDEALCVKEVSARERGDQERRKGCTVDRDDGGEALPAFDHEARVRAFAQQREDRRRRGIKAAHAERLEEQLSHALPVARRRHGTLRDDHLQVFVKKRAR